MRLLLLAAGVLAVAGCTTGPQSIGGLASVYDGLDFIRYEAPQVPNECATAADCSVQGYFHEVCTNSRVRILDFHENATVREDTACACVQSMCQWVPKAQYGCPKDCPAVVPPHADFCEGGTLVATPPDDCGCERMLTCVLSENTSI